MGLKLSPVELQWTLVRDQISGHPPWHMVIYQWDNSETLYSRDVVSSHQLFYTVNSFLVRKESSIKFNHAISESYTLFIDRSLDIRGEYDFYGRMFYLGPQTAFFHPSFSQNRFLFQGRVRICFLIRRKQVYIQVVAVVSDMHNKDLSHITSNSLYEIIAIHV